MNRSLLPANNTGTLWLAVMLFLGALAVSQAWAAPSDVPPSSSPRELTVVGDRLFFSADDGLHGRELWMWRASAGGRAASAGGSCSMVADLCPGPEGSNPTALQNIAGWLYFRASTPGSGRGLWVCGGPNPVPILVKGSAPGPAPTRMLLFAQPQAAGGRVFVLTCTESPDTAEEQLWIGEPGSATLVLYKSFPLGRPEYMMDGCMLPSGKLVLGARSLVFACDGTENGTQLLLGEDLQADAPGGQFFKCVGERAVFVASSQSMGMEPWVTDGTPERTRLLRDIYPGTEPSTAINMFVANGNLFFQANDGVHGGELWRTDGTPESTVLVRDIQPGRGASDPHYFGAAGGLVFFVADDGIHGKELWRAGADGNEAMLVSDFFPGPRGAEPWSLLGAGGRLYFCAQTLEYGEEIYSTDGTPEGTGILRDIRPGSANASPGQLTAFQDKLFFTCNDGIHGAELWQSDFRSTGTQLAADIFPERENPSSSPKELTALDGKLLFVADTVAYGQELWVSDGTESGTTLLRDLAPGSAGAMPHALKAGTRRLYFCANDGSTGEELWSSDGTALGTAQVQDLLPGPEGSSPHLFLVVNNVLYFTARTRANSREWWRTDGTKAGTQRIEGQNDLSSIPEIVQVLELNGAVYGYALESPECAAVWRVLPDRPAARAVLRVPLPADPWRPGLDTWGEPLHDMLTPNDAFLIRALHPFPGGNSAAAPAVLGGITFFVANVDPYGAELWKTGGQPENTSLVRDCYPGVVSSSPAMLQAAGKEMLFVADHPQFGRVLWRSDGTPDGTIPVVPQNGAEVFRPIETTEAVALGTRLIAVRFRTTEAPVGTGRLVESSVGSPNSTYAEFKEPHARFSPRQLTPVQHQVFFTADDGIHGEELWVVGEGGLRGAHMVRDLSGPVDLSPRPQR